MTSMTSRTIGESQTSEQSHNDTVHVLGEELPRQSGPQASGEAVPEEDSTSLLDLGKGVPHFSHPDSSLKSELFLSTQVFSDALSSLPSHFDRHQLLDFCLSLKIISKESHSHLLQLEIIKFPLDHAFIPAPGNFESFDNVLKLWNATEIIVQQLQLAAQYLKDEITDALLIILSFLISADHIKPLADCLSCSVLESNESVSSTALQILWNWRDKEALHANCRTLVQALLASETLPTNITEFVISYIKSRHQNQLLVTLSSKNELDEPSITEMRLSFARAYIKVFEENTQERIAKWLNVASDINIHDFILRRCNWVNYDFLKELDDDLGNKKVFGLYAKQYESTMKNFCVFQIPPQSIPAVPISGRCIFSIVFQSSMWNFYSGSVLYEIKSKLSKKWNIKEVHWLISGIDEASLCIDVSIERQILQEVTRENLSFNWEDKNWISYDTLVGGSSYPLSADSLDTDIYSSPIVDQAADELEGDFVSGKDLQLTLSTFDHKDETKFSAAVEDVDIVGAVLVNLYKGPKLEISMKEFKRIILNQKVPVALCLVAVMGLPDCNKTSILEKIFRLNIKLKETATLKFEDYMMRKEDRNGLSIYELCVLGGKPYDQYSWSFTTERYGAIFSILCGLVRHAALAKSDIKNVEFLHDGHVSHRLVDEHFKWLMRKADKQLKDISMDDEKEALLLNGLTLANIMDVGVNKALYDFLPIMLSFCRNHLRLVFFSLERDGPKLNEGPDLSADRYSIRGDNCFFMTRRPRINHILHFATLGHDRKQKEEDDSKRTLIVATSKGHSIAVDSHLQFNEAKVKMQEEAKKQSVERFFSNVIHVSINDCSSLKSAEDKITAFIMKDKVFQKSLPLSWIFLRSLVISAQQKEGDIKTMILRKRDIYDYAAKEIEMDEEEFENFLVTFTDFGSILYMPQFRSLRDIVVVDIWEFMQFLNKLFYPEKEKQWYKELTTYGVIKKTHASEILKQYVESFMLIIITFGMAAEIGKGKYGRALSDKCYYLPSARIGKKSFPCDHNNEYAFLKIESVNFPVNIQASISHEIMKKPNFYLIANESFDTSQFGFRTPSGRPIQITMVYGDSKTKLIFRIKDTSTEMYHCLSACKGVIDACCDSLNRMASQIRYLKYSIGIPCSADDGNSHYIYFNDDSDLHACQACARSNDVTISCRKCWIEAAKTCDKLRRKEDILTFEELSQVVQDVAKKNMIPALKTELKVEIHKTAKSYQEDRQAMEALMKWETKQRCPRHSLIKILQQMQLNSTADKLKQHLPITSP